MFNRPANHIVRHMVVTVTLSTAAEDFPLGQVFTSLPDAQIELERVIPRGETLLPYAWIYGEEAGTVQRAIETSEHVHRVDVLDALPDRTLVRIEWEPTVDGLITAITDQEATILDMDGDAKRWRFQLRFPNSEAASGFQQQCHEFGLTIDITTVHDSSRPETAQMNELTGPQREVLTYAIENGFFDIPRRTSLVRLANEFDISDQAASERLRRAQKTICRVHLEL